MGEKDYVCPINHNIPTDFERIVKEGIFLLYEEKQDENIINLLKEALLFLVHGNAVQIWIAYCVCWELKKSEYEGSSPFTISDDSFWKTVMNMVLEKEESLRSCHEWKGQNLKKGLWGDILKMDKYFEDEDKTRILNVLRWSYSGANDEQIYNLTKKAYERDELPELLCGEIGYICQTNRFFPAAIPTDFDNIMYFGIYRIYKETKDEKIVTELKKALLKMTQGDPVQIWEYRHLWHLSEVFNQEVEYFLQHNSSNQYYLSTVG